MQVCSICGTKADEMFQEVIYFKDYGLWCQKCFDRHMSIGFHLCCQDFKNSKGEWVHYNLPYISKQAINNV
jgi:hypothetical protein